MPQNKDLKRVVRSRMTKTGESYTAARAQIVSKSPDQTATLDEATQAPDYAALAGTAEATLVARTGRGWAEWVRELDAHRAYEMKHGEIAALVYEGGFGVSGWWSQTVTVGYERIRGLRAPGQRSDGAYEASKSRTFNVPIDTLFEACAEERLRGRWLTDVDATVRAATPPRSLRLQWPDGTIVALWFEAKGEAKSTLSLAHQKLPDRAAVEQAKQAWTKRLEALWEVLSGRA